MRSSRTRTSRWECPDADIRFEKGIAALRHAVARLEAAAAALTVRSLKAVRATGSERGLKPGAKGVNVAH
jgi:hypothetical protein